MLLLSCMIGILIVIAITFLYDFLSVFINRQLLNDRTDRLALEAAAKFNEGDRTSRMNHLLVQSRNLIFLSRQTYVTTTALQPYNHLSPLAHQLLEQSRDGAKLLEKEQARLVAARLAEVKKNIISPSLNQAGSSLFGNISVDGLDVGTMDGFTSEVPSAYSASDLKENDAKDRYIDKKTGDYFGEVDVKLPTEDRDLSFKLSSLPVVAKQGALQKSAPYKQYATLRKDGADIPFKCEQMPTAVRLQLHAKYRGLLTKQEYDLSANSVATGAGPAFK
ncbi:MAG: hypothetical protein C5B53_06895 [Candidatus Melainabacteria bacterium]|nr:MAG: hypothetical protein C5B53_06895 [Candidatus Melainabacteria bacterium]